MKIWLRVMAILTAVSAVVAFWAFRREQLDRDLYAAVQRGDLKAVRNLLDRGASPRSVPRKMPPLQVAISRRHTEVALALIRAGADGVPDRFLCSAVLARD